MEKFYKLVDRVRCDNVNSLGVLVEDPSSKGDFTLKDFRRIKSIGEENKKEDDTFTITHVGESSLDTLVQIVNIKEYLNKLGKVARIYHPVTDDYLPLVVSKKVRSNCERDYIIHAKDWVLIPKKFKKYALYRYWVNFRETGDRHGPMNDESMLNRIIGYLTNPIFNTNSVAWGYLTNIEAGELIANTDSVTMTKLGDSREEFILRGSKTYGVIYRDPEDNYKWQPTADYN